MGPQPPSCHLPGGLKQTVLWKFSERKGLSQAFCLNSPHLFSQPLPAPLPPCASPHFPFSYLFFSPLLLFFKRAELTALALSKANQGASQEQPWAADPAPSSPHGCPTLSLHVAVSGSVGKAVVGRGEGDPCSQEKEPHLPAPSPLLSNSSTRPPVPRHTLPWGN